MNSNRRLVSALKFLVVLTLIGSLVAVRASAHPALPYHGNFTLPFQVIWGGTILEPGEYSIIVESAGSKSFTTVRVENGAASLTLRSISRDAVVGQSMLIVKRNGKKFTVDAVYLAELGVILYFEGNGQKGPARDPKPSEEKIPIRSVPWGACPEYCLG